jgi:hypothetical protein
MTYDRKPLIHLSQGQLNLLEICPPYFQHLYLDKLGSPIDPEQQETFNWGSQFHRLLQQRELGLPIESLLQIDRQLQQAMTALVEAAPDIWQSNGKTWREAEYCRSLGFQGYLLTAIYDLLIADQTHAQIIDWKTYLKPENKTKLAKNWQTRLYLYILAETSDYLPQEISMTYWFIKLPTNPQSLTFTYDSNQHSKTKQDLTCLLAQLDDWLEGYRHGISFPHLPNCQESCPYASGNNTRQGQPGSRNAAITKDWLTSIAEIEEIPIESSSP